jgi:hypothetical protein
MGIVFAENWKTADPWYTTRYGSYQVFLDSVNQQQVMQALWLANGHFTHPWVREILLDAGAGQGTHDVIVEQGIHQPENLKSGGFTLHFTIRNDRGRAYHMYIKQNNAGSIQIDEISWMDRGIPTSDFYR